jgi:hypothetical protein
MRSCLTVPTATRQVGREALGRGSGRHERARPRRSVPGTVAITRPGCGGGGPAICTDTWQRVLGARDAAAPWARATAGETLPETRVKRPARPPTGRTRSFSRADRLTFRAAVRDGVDDYLNRQRSLVDLQRHLRLHLAACFGRYRMAAITTADVRRCVVRRQHEGARNATINREPSVLKRAFTFAIAAG